MKVKQLINELKKMPQHIDVSVAMHDNYEYEVAGDVRSVLYFTKDKYGDIVDEPVGYSAQDEFNDMPDECVILRC